MENIISFIESYKVSKTKSFDELRDNNERDPFELLIKLTLWEIGGMKKLFGAMVNYVPVEDKVHIKKMLDDLYNTVINLDYEARGFGE